MVYVVLVVFVVFEFPDLVCVVVVIVFHQLCFRCCWLTMLQPARQPDSRLCSQLVSLNFDENSVRLRPIAVGLFSTVLAVLVFPSQLEKITYIAFAAISQFSHKMALFGKN